MSWREEVAEINRRRAFAEALGGKESVDRQHAAGRLTVTLDGGPRLVFPSGHRSFPTPAVFPAAIPRFCCRAAVDRPRAPFLVTMSLHSPDGSGGESELLVGNSLGCPV